MLAIPLALLFLMRDGLISHILDMPMPARVEQAEETTTLNDHPRTLTPPRDGWSSVTLETAEEKAAAAKARELAEAQAAAQAAASAPPSDVKAVPQAKDAIRIKQPTSPVPIGKH